jgi:LuxR family transcriptional regulator, maltose regulon positive regulatory protein
MSTPILATKLLVPSLPSSRVPRRRLITQLDEGLERKLTLLSAPVGFGKTTLLADWIHEKAAGRGQKEEDSAFALLPTAFAWLSLDENDNDPTLFLAYLVAALQTVDETLGETAVSLLQSPQPPSPQLVMGSLINDLACRQERLVLTLDDYHVIENQVIHEALAYLLDHQPPGLHLALTSRADPPLPLSRLRVRLQMTEIRAADLRFTHEEAAVFLQQVWQINLSPNHIAALEQRTEGWIAGLQLAALSLERLQSAADIANFVADFAGSHRYILDYLADEVLQQQSPEVQTFLLHSSMLDRLCADLCQAVLETADAQAMLERLEAANLFLIPLDGRRQWFRYHHLFADLLRHRLKQTRPDLLPTLHQRASQWHEAQGIIDEAVKHAMSAGDMQRSAKLLEGARWQAHSRGQIVTLQRWLDMLPAEIVDQNGTLAMGRVWIYLYTGRIAEAETYLAQVEPILAAQQDNEAPAVWRGEMAVLQAQLALNQGEFEQALWHIERAHTLMPEDNLFARSLMELLSGGVYRSLGRLEEAKEAFVASGELGSQTNDQTMVLWSLTGRAGLHDIQGQLAQAEALCYQALALVQDKRGRYLPAASVPLIGLGRVQRQWNNLDKAQRHLEEALQLAQNVGLNSVAMDGGIALAMVYAAQGAFEQAHNALNQSRQFTQWSQFQLAELKIGATEAFLWLLEGEVDKATAWADDFVAQIGESRIGETGGWFEPEYTILARIRLAQGEAEAAQQLLAGLLPAAEAAGRVGRVIEILTLQALAWQANGESDQALDTLTDALTLAQPHGYVRLFADEGRPLGELLAKVVLMEAAVSDYAADLLTAFDAGPAAPVGQPATADKTAPTVSPELAHWLAEPLSERELEVLALVAQGMTNREASERLFVSVATVKKHMENIHGKLYVSNRTQAVARARELGLL